MNAQIYIWIIEAGIGYIFIGAMIALIAAKLDGFLNNVPNSLLFISMYLVIAMVCLTACISVVVGYCFSSESYILFLPIVMILLFIGILSVVCIILLSVKLDTNPQWGWIIVFIPFSLLWW